jgi:hypothetical protein
MKKDYYLIIVTFTVCLLMNISANAQKNTYSFSNFEARFKIENGTEYTFDVTRNGEVIEQGRCTIGKNQNEDFTYISVRGASDVLIYKDGHVTQSGSRVCDITKTKYTLEEAVNFAINCMIYLNYVKP